MPWMLVTQVILSVLSHLYNTLDNFKANVTAFSVNDEQIRQIIREVNQQFNYVVCPHTATGYFARKELFRAMDNCSNCRSM